MSCTKDAGKKQDLSFGCDVRGDNAFFMTWDSWNKRKVDILERIGGAKPQATFYRIIDKDGNQLPDHGWMAPSDCRSVQIVQYG